MTANSRTRVVGAAVTSLIGVLLTSGLAELGAPAWLTGTAAAAVVGIALLMVVFVLVSRRGFFGRGGEMGVGQVVLRLLGGAGAIGAGFLVIEALQVVGAPSWATGLQAALTVAMVLYVGVILRLLTPRQQGAVPDPSPRLSDR